MKIYVPNYLRYRVRHFLWMVQKLILFLRIITHPARFYVAQSSLAHPSIFQDNTDIHLLLCQWTA